MGKQEWLPPGEVIEVPSVCLWIGHSWTLVMKLSSYVIMIGFLLNCRKILMPGLASFQDYSRLLDSVCHCSLFSQARKWWTGIFSMWLFLTANLWLSISVPRLSILVSLWLLPYSLALSEIFIIPGRVQGLQWGPVSRQTHGTVCGWFSETPESLGFHGQCCDCIQLAKIIIIIITIIIIIR